MHIGLLRETKIPADNRVALIPSQCKWLQKQFPGLKVSVQPSTDRSFTDREYERAGVEITEDLGECDFIFGIKEVKAALMIPGKQYLFFSHTRKMQSFNQAMFRTMQEKNITLIDYECLEHEDGQRILGFGFFAGVVGAHNGIMAYGNRTGAYQLARVFEKPDYKQVINSYFGLKLPNIKVVITGSGRVAHGLLEIMNLLGVVDIEPEEYLSRDFTYPVFTQLKGSGLYKNKMDGGYQREHFHSNPSAYQCHFLPFAKTSDILLNGIYWEPGVPRLFEWEDMLTPGFRIKTIADVTDDEGGSVPCNLGDTVIEDPVYGVNPKTREKTAPYLSDGVDVMAVGNLPNELPRDASRYFGEQLIKYVLEDLLTKGSAVIDRATILKSGAITPRYSYLKDYGLPT